MSSQPERLTELLNSPRLTTSELLPLVYNELRALAKQRLAHEKPGQTLQPTALVHEAFLRVADKNDRGWDGRRHFFAAAAEAMRRILINQARSKAAAKRGGERARQELDTEALGIEPPDERILQIDEALGELEAVDPRARDLVNLRYFTGLSIRETAEALGMSTSTVDREWRFIRSFLAESLSRP